MYQKKPFRVSKNVEKWSFFVQYHNKKIMHFIRHFFEVKFCPIFLEFVFYFGGIQEKTEERSPKVEGLGFETFQDDTRNLEKFSKILNYLIPF